METPLFLLWDHAHIWGHMALRALNTLGVPCRVVTAQDIAHDALSCKPPLLLVPGGTARLKASALGATGCQAVRDYVATGGHYLGFCGGAGLGLTGDDGVGLCPWTRAPYTDRTQHLISGHIVCRLHGHDLCRSEGRHEKSKTHTASKVQEYMPLPVWWPGRFAPQDEDTVTVLARYDCAHKDLCLADIPLASLPEGTLDMWRTVYGVDMGVAFMTGQPCIIAGSYGHGQYVLSYSHLETPDSPQANAWLAHLLRVLAQAHPVCDTLPMWHVDTMPEQWSHTALTSPLYTAREGVARLMDLGVAHHLLFKRTSWLYGWRAGIPGAALNNLHTSLCMACACTPTDSALAYWQKHVDSFTHASTLFLQGAEGYLLAERLATTLPAMVARHGLRVQREALFGLPMEGGGLYQELVSTADTLTYLCAH